MKIGSYNVSMASANTYSQVTQKTSSFVLEENTEVEPRESQEITRKSYNADGTVQIRSMAELRQLLLNQLLDALQGRKTSYKDAPSYEDLVRDGQKNGGNIVTSGSYRYQSLETESYSEEQTTGFVSTGCVTTEDGRQIEFNMCFSMERSYRTDNLTYKEGDVVMCDPLVINFDGDLAELTDEKFSFDLDADGECEEISKFAGNSGFLALDLNGNGIIDDGSELFGTKSGDAFGDLAAYDEDGNGWIDENDSVFEKLKVFTPNQDTKLTDLASTGVGAIFLGRTTTNFSLNNLYDNAVNGTIVESGIYLGEDGTVGTLQHVDFAV